VKNIDVIFRIVTDEFLPKFDVLVLKDVINLNLYGEEGCYKIWLPFSKNVIFL